jgi:DNA invertase Pin-like site-specific DNA recombinase
MIYGYARVSSIGQAKDGNSLEAQEKALREKGCEKIYSEAFTGTTTHRPEFSKMIDILQEGDTLVVTKLDRFSRTADEGARLVKELHCKGVIIDILNMGRVDNTPMGKLMVTMLLAFAEFEHDNIIERLNTGKAIAKSHGKKTDGRYRKDPPDFQKFLKKQKDGELSVKECCKELGISRATWYNKLKEVC